MNGRIYDPLLGRFLSADLIVQAPTNLQSYNRYSYVMNNPLSLTDPSGFSWLSEFSAGVVVGWAEGNDPTGTISGRVEAHFQESGVPGVPTSLTNTETTGRVVGNLAAAVQGLGEMMLGESGKALGAGMVGLGSTEAVVASPTVAGSAPGVLVAGAGVAAIAGGQVVETHGMIVTATSAVRAFNNLQNLAKSDIKSGGGDKVDSRAPSNQRERLYQKGEPGEPTKHGNQARSGSRGEISRAPSDGQAALDNSVRVKEKPNGELRVGVDRTNKEVVVLDRQQQKGKQDIFHGHVPKVLKSEVRNAIQKDKDLSKLVRINKNGTWEVVTPQQ